MKKNAHISAKNQYVNITVSAEVSFTDSCPDPSTAPPHISAPEVAKGLFAHAGRCHLATAVQTHQFLSRSDSASEVWTELPGSPRHLRFTKQRQQNSQCGRQYGHQQLTELPGLQNSLPYAVKAFH